MEDLLEKYGNLIVPPTCPCTRQQAQAMPTVRELAASMPGIGIVFPQFIESLVQHGMANPHGVMYRVPADVIDLNSRRGA